MCFKATKIIKYFDSAKIIFQTAYLRPADSSIHPAGRQSAQRQFRGHHKTLINNTSTARCTVYVQYMYSICTLRKRTNTVHILYIYCTTGSAGGQKNRFSGRADAGVPTSHCGAPQCAARCRGGSRPKCFAVRDNKSGLGALKRKCHS